MLTYLSSSIWAPPTQTLVNTVNVVGAMGKEITLVDQIPPLPEKI